jgi:hypothetical protein
MNYRAAKPILLVTPEFRPARNAGALNPRPKANIYRTAQTLTTADRKGRPIGAILRICAS